MRRLRRGRGRRTPVLLRFLVDAASVTATWAVERTGEDGARTLTDLSRGTPVRLRGPFVIIPPPAAMSLAPGTRFGAYEIVSQIGEGGMGVVYRARDTKLNRDVALKVLPDLFAIDADRLARFNREAQDLASLNHPNIAQIHGLEESAVFARW